jgi:hypothetical protein
VQFQPALDRGDLLQVSQRHRCASADGKSRACHYGASQSRIEISAIAFVLFFGRREVSLGTPGFEARPQWSASIVDRRRTIRAVQLVNAFPLDGRIYDPLLVKNVFAVWAGRIVGCPVRGSASAFPSWHCPCSLSFVSLVDFDVGR